MWFRLTKNRVEATWLWHGLCRGFSSDGKNLLSNGVSNMIIADRLRAIREQKNMSQGDIEKKTGLLRCYVSRVENGHTVPAIETLEKLARAMEVPLYVFFYDGEKPPALKVSPTEKGWGDSGKDARTLSRFRRLLGRTSVIDQNLLLFMAQKMAQRKRPKRMSA
jgi:transcriptional regulator with XRE-family HTH domain